MPDQDAALIALRLADPARGYVSNPTGMPVTDVGREAASPITPAVRPQSGPPWWLASMAAAVLVAVVIGSTVLWTSHRADKRHAALANTSATATSPMRQGQETAGDVSNRAETERIITSLLNEFPNLPGAVTTTKAPDSQLRNAMSPLPSRNALDSSRWFTAPGSVTEALAYVRAHLPGGLTEESAQSSSNTSLRSVTFLAATTASTYQPQVTFTAVATAHGIAGRVDAEAVWIPARTPGEQIKSPSSVDVQISGWGLVPIRQNLGRRAAATLAAQLNAQDTAPPIELHGCGPDVRNLTDLLTFKLADGRTATATIRPEGCGSVTIASGGSPQSALNGAVQLHNTLIVMLNLSDSYRAS